MSMNFIQKLLFLSKLQKAVEEVKKVLKEPATDKVYNAITGGINKIAEGLNDIKNNVPAVSVVVDKILKVLQYE